MSFLNINQKKDPPILEQESNIMGEPASVPDSSLFNKENVQKLETMVKGKYPHNDDHSTGIRHANIVSIVAIACVALFLVLSFTTDLPGKILIGITAQSAAASTSVSSNEQPDTENSNSSPRIVVLPRDDMTKDELLTHLGDMSDEDVQLILEAIQMQQLGNSTNVDPVTSSVAEPGPALDGAIEAEHQFSGQVDGSKRLRLVEDLNLKDYMYYVAEDGDTLLALSKSFGVSLGQILELNGLHDADVIRAGEILLFPGDTKQPNLSGK